MRQRLEHDLHTGMALSPARLRVMREVRTCIPGHDRVERFDCQSGGEATAASPPADEAAAASGDA